MHILYDASLISNPQSTLFDPRWLQANANVTSVAHGRGQAWFVDYQQHHWVLRHYLRGGMVANWNRDFYLGWSLRHSRAWKEWQLLLDLRQKNLPVPQPVAARVNWPLGRISGIYQADILLERIPGAKTLARRIQESTLTDQLWQVVGECIRLFHDHNVYHADLNANNILFDKHDQIYLIDFDRGEIREHGEWKMQNVNRLQRSLLKLKSQYGEFNFTDSDWRRLLDAYEGNIDE